MTASAEHPAERPGGLMTRAGLWLGHYSSEILDLTLVNVAVALVLDGFSPRLSAVWSALVGGPLVTAAVLAMMSQLTIHRRRLCWRELHEAPLTDPQGAVDRNHNNLHRYHHGFWHLAALLMVPYMLVAIWVLDEPYQGVEWVHLAVFVGVSMPIGLFHTWLHRIHDRLQPWCPFCRRDGDDDGFLVPEPDPDPARKVPLPR